jgi:ubiquinone/menaquinone biosynthesis C-methylase UbiE
MDDSIAFYSGGISVRTYDIFMARDNSPLAGDTSFYLNAAHRFGTSVLELGVGTARIAIELANAGCAVTGLDASQAMLDVAKSKIAKLPRTTVDRIRLVHGNMQDFDLGGQFQLALIPARAFQHVLEPTMQRSTLLAVHRHLTSGGYLVIDMFDPRLEYCIANPPDTELRIEVFDPASGLTLRRTSNGRLNDLISQTFSEKLLFEVIDQSSGVVACEDTSWSLRWTFRQEMRYLLELTGFEVIEQYSDFKGSPPAYGLEQVWVARAV